MNSFYVSHTYFSQLAVDNTTDDERKVFAKCGLLNELGFIDPQPKFKLETITQSESETLVSPPSGPCWVRVIRTSIDIDEGNTADV